MLNVISTCRDILCVDINVDKRCVDHSTTTHHMRRMKFGTIQKFSVASNIWLKIETFDHSGPAKDEIWQHPEILSRVENLAQNWQFEKEIFNHSRPAKDEICLGALQYQMDTGVKLALPKAGAFGENTISKNEGSLGEKPILVQN